MERFSAMEVLQAGVRGTLGTVMIAISLASFVGCGRMPTAVGPGKVGSLEIRAAVCAPLAKTSSLLQTQFDSLIVEVSGEDFGTIRHARKLSAASPVVADTLMRIPVGSNRTVKVSTVNSAGTPVHVDSLPAKVVRIDPGVTTMVNSVLVPALGSIYLQIGGVPTKVDSIVATFVSSDNRAWGARAKRSPKVYLNIDNIPHRTRGFLGVAGIDSVGDTLYAAKTEIAFDARTTTSVPLQFTSTPGGLALQLAINLPGATVVTGSMAGTDSTADESGTLIITEIMYAANDSEYIELFNPGSTDLTFDTLIVDIDGTDRVFANVQVAAQGTMVIGRKPLPWVDLSHTALDALDLTSTGNWITVRSKDRRIIDRVIFAAGSNGLEWPSVTGKQSITLDTSATNANANNYGRNWRIVRSPIEGTGQSGTPRVR